MQLLLTNKNNQTLDLLNNRRQFLLKSAEGLHGIETDIAESESPYMDGSTIESVKALPRGIELTFKLIGDVKKSIDYFTSIVKSKQYVTLREIEGERDIVIKGIATIPPYTRMAQSCEIVLSIYCGQPYWETIEYMVTVISKAIDLLYFPVEGQYFTANGRPFGVFETELQKTVANEGDTAVGALFEFLALGTVVKPRISCSTGDQNGAYMQLDLTLNTNDILKINTIKGAKYITINGLETYNGDPILNYLQFVGEDWLQVEQGNNTFNITAESGAENVYFTILYKARYE